MGRLKLQLYRLFDIETGHSRCQVGGVAAGKIGVPNDQRAMPGLDVKEAIELPFQTPHVVAPLRIGWGVLAAETGVEVDSTSSRQDLRCLQMR